MSKVAESGNLNRNVLVLMRVYKYYPGRVGSVSASLERKKNPIDLDVKLKNDIGLIAFNLVKIHDYSGSCSDPFIHLL